MDDVEDEGMSGVVPEVNNDEEIRSVISSVETFLDIEKDELLFLLQNYKTVFSHRSDL